MYLIKVNKTAILFVYRKSALHSSLLVKATPVSNMAEPAEATRMVVDEGKAVDSPMEAQVQKLAEKVWSEFFPASCLQASLKQAQLSKIVLCL